MQVGRLVSELLANEDLVVVTRELQLAHPSTLLLQCTKTVGLTDEL